VVYRTKKSAGAITGLVMGCLIFGFCFWGINYSLGPGDEALKVALLIPLCFFLGVFVLVLIGAFNLYYVIETDGLKIRWGLRSIMVPWTEIQQVIAVKGKSNMFSIFGVSWPGHIIGLYSVKGLGPARMCGTKIDDGFIYVKSSRGFFGLTPQDPNFVEEITIRADKELEVVDMDTMPEDIKGKSMQDDNFYRLLFIINVSFLLLFAGYLAVFFPGSGAPNFIILLLVLAVALFFFNIGNAGRLYQFSNQGGYILLVIGIAVTGTFLILALSEISL